MILCARSMLRSREESMNADHAARTFEGFVYSIVNDFIIIKHGRHLFEKFMRSAKVCGLFQLMCFWDTDWLGRQLRSHGRDKGGSRETKVLKLEVLFDVT